MTCGMGRFFNYIPNEKRLYGLDVDEKALEIGKILFPEATIRLRTLQAAW